jgi:hypothetical protein
MCTFASINEMFCAIIILPSFCGVGKPLMQLGFFAILYFVAKRFYKSHLLLKLFFKGIF